MRNSKRTIVIEIVYIYFVFVFYIRYLSFNKLIEIIIKFSKIWFRFVLNCCLNIILYFVFNIIDFILFFEKIIIICLNFCYQINFLYFLFCCVVIKKQQFEIFMFKKRRFVFVLIWFVFWFVNWFFEKLYFATFFIKFFDICFKKTRCHVFFVEIFEKCLCLFCVFQSTFEIRYCFF